MSTADVVRLRLAAWAERVGVEAPVVTETEDGGMVAFAESHLSEGDKP